MKKEQIIEFLKSDDLEMVKLGAVYLQKFVHKRYWTKILADCRIVEHHHEDPVPFGGPWTYSKWDYRIEGKIIIILEQEITTNANPGLWSQLGSGYKHTYNMGTFNLGTLKTAIGQFYNKQKPTRNEQTKKKQYRKQSK